MPGGKTLSTPCEGNTVMSDPGLFVGCIKLEICAFEICAMGLILGSSNLMQMHGDVSGFSPKN